jgi:tRNA nucleotidyltransferase/poly(A) polymerase
VSADHLLTPRDPLRPLWWSDAVLDLQDTLSNDDSPIYIVGGAVRDAFLHRPIHDLDIATPNSAIRLGKKIANALKGDFYVLDEERDVARAIAETIDGRLEIDVARFRAEDLLSDLQDRDFTINAMAVDLKADISQLIDPLNGEDDLLKRIIRRCSDHSMSDDPIRALRAVRQSIQFKGRIEPETLKDIRSVANRLTDTSPERVRDEFFKLLDGTKPASALRVADTLGLLAQIIPEIEGLRDLALPPPSIDGWSHTLATIEKLHGILHTISPHRTDETAAVFDFGMVVMALDVYRSKLQAHLGRKFPNDRSYAAVLLLAALLHHAPLHDAEARAEALRLSNDEKKRLIAIVQHHDLIMNMPRMLSDLDIHRFWHGLGESGVDICLFTLADHLGAAGNELKQDVWIALIDYVKVLLDAYYVRYDEVVAPPQLLDGNRLMSELGLEPGPQIGKLLDDIREGQVMGEVQSAEDALNIARRSLNGNLNN